MARASDSTLGPLLVGRTAANRPGPAGRGLPSQLAAFSMAAAKRMDTPVGAALVFRADSFSGGVVLLLAVQGLETDALRFPALGARIRARRVYGDQQLAANAQRSGLGAARGPIFPSRNARRAGRLERSLVGRLSGCCVPERPPSDSDLHQPGYGWSLDLLLECRPQETKVVPHIWRVSCSCQCGSNSAGL